MTGALLRQEMRGMAGRVEAAPGGLLAYPYHWQIPAATEQTAWDAVAAEGLPDGVDYLGLPWATLIDGLRNDAAQTWSLLDALEDIRTGHPRAPGRRRATVAQHIHAGRFIELFAAGGVTDLFWSHATADGSEIGGLRIHPFPLYPAQTADAPPPDDIHRPRRYLANFIGAYNPRIYLSDMRARIFEDAGRAPDLLIVKRDAWHFNRAVYAEQMKGIRPDEARLQLEARHKEEYLDAIRDSVFTLCPTGSGPNSIRIGEALALGSIPVILTRTLALPGDRALWERACLIEEDSAEGYARALARMRAMPAAERQERQTATQALSARIGPGAWGRLIRDMLDAPGVTSPTGGRAAA